MRLHVMNKYTHIYTLRQIQTNYKEVDVTVYEWFISQRI